MAKALPVEDAAGGHAGWMVLCPGCGHGHLFDARWKFNGDAGRPGFGPAREGAAHSMLVRSTRPDPAGGPGQVPTVCHSYVEDGRIRFLEDCTHALRGQTVELEDFRT